MFPEQVKTAERVQLDQIPLPDAPVATPTSKYQDTQYLSIIILGLMF